MGAPESSRRRSRHEHRLARRAVRVNGSIAALSRWLVAAPWRPLLLIVLPLCAVALFGRGLWTPDEPREFDLAVTMLRSGQLWFPHFVGQPYCEKPPLTYWVSVVAMSMFGSSPAIARLPNLLWITLTWWAVFRLARALAASAAQGAQPTLPTGLAVALILTTSWLALQREVWLATDGPLLAATAVSLLGLWLTLDVRSSSPRYRGPLLFSIGMTLAFFAKNSFGWLVPGLALLAWIVWMRRPRDLLRPELWLAGMGTVGAVGFWLWQVSMQPHGGECVQQLLWSNGLGRLLPIATPEGYHLGHRNWFGKYVLQLPWLLMPWTALAIAAMRLAWTRIRESNDRTGAWRFCVCAAAPAWLTLFLSATGRDVYFIPSLVGVACGIGLWLAEARGRSWLERQALTVTDVFIGLLCGLIALAAVYLAYDTAKSLINMQILGPLLALGLAPWALTRALPEPVPRLARGALTLAVTFVLCAPALLPAMDRTQDLAPLLRAAAPYLDRHVITMGSEETLQAYMESELRLQPRMAKDVATVQRWLQDDPGLRVLVRADATAKWRRYVESHPGVPRERAEVRALKDLGLTELRTWQIDKGRAYVLMGIRP